MVQVRFTLRSRDQQSIWMQDGCEVHMDSCMASNGPCFMVTWTIFNNHLLEVGLTQNPDTMAFRMLTTVGLFYCIMCEEPAWIVIHWKSIWLRAQSHMTAYNTRESVTTLHDIGGVLGRPLDAFFWALATISWSRLLARVWSGPELRGHVAKVKEWTLKTRTTTKHGENSTRPMLLSGPIYISVWEAHLPGRKVCTYYIPFTSGMPGVS